MADEKIIFSMNGVGKVLPHNNKVILKDIYLSFFYGAKIGIIGLNGSGKSTLMKIIAGVEKSYKGEVVWAPGYSVGYLEQEPQMDPDKTVLICQIVAGGVGLNVQEANVIIICEPQLKPSLEEQAIGRAYRMGQSRKVVVHRLLSAKTVDERIMDILSGKRETFLAFANESVVGNIDRERAIGEAAVEEIIAAERERYGIDKNPDETTEDDG